MTRSSTSHRRLFVCALLVLAACNRRSEDYYPLTSGMSWEYNSTLVATPKGGGHENTMVGRFVLTNQASRLLAGKTVVPQKMDLGGYISFAFIAETPEGLVMMAEQRPGDAEPQIKQPINYLLRYPVTVGTRWESQEKTSFVEPGTAVNATNTIESTADSVTVPAGTFRGCLRSVSIGTVEVHPKDLMSSAEITVEVTAWHAPRIGVVKITKKETSNRPILGSAELTYQLVSMS